MSDIETSPAPATKDAIRSSFFNQTREVKTVTFRGQKFEVKSPALKTFMRAGGDQNDPDSTAKAVLRLFIETAYVADTDEKVFTDADLDALMAMPYNSELAEVFNVMNSLTGIDVPSAEKNSEATT